MTRHAGLIALLVLLGAGWGLTMPLSKIAVSEGYRTFGLIFWQLVVGVLVLAPLNRLRGRGLPFGPSHLRWYLFIALFGTLLPNGASYAAVVHLPAGIMAIAISAVPLFAFPIALLLGTDRFSPFRVLGLLLGLAGVGLLVGPEASLPERAMAAFVPLALVAPFLYAIEGNVVAKWGGTGLDPVQLLLGASLTGALIAAPVAVLTGNWIDPRPPWAAPDAALVAASVIHALVYAVYVWLVGRAGATFAAQVSYLVTGFGMVWAMLFLKETYSGWVWAALGLMFLGLFLVQPREKPALPPPA